MATSLKRTTVAVLRSILDITKPQLADVLECSTHALDSIEMGRLKLSEALAYKTAIATGVSVDWLLDGNPKARPITQDGTPYSVEDFHRAQAKKGFSHFALPWQVTIEAMGFYGQLRAIMANASRGKQALALYKIQKAIDDLRAEFGQDDALYPQAVMKEIDEIAADTFPELQTSRPKGSEPILAGHARAIMEADLEVEHSVRQVSQSNVLRECEPVEDWHQEFQRWQNRPQISDWREAFQRALEKSGAPLPIEKTKRASRNRKAK